MPGPGRGGWRTHAAHLFDGGQVGTRALTATHRPCPRAAIGVMHHNGVTTVPEMTTHATQSRALR